MVNNVHNHANSGFRLCTNVNVVCKWSHGNAGLAINHGEQFYFPAHFKLINETLTSIIKTQYTATAFSFTSRVIIFTAY